MEHEEDPNQLDPADLQFDIFRHPTGNINKTECAVRVTHVPTGISVTEFNQSSKNLNQEVAIAKLEKKVKESIK